MKELGEKISEIDYTLKQVEEELNLEQIKDLAVPLFLITFEPLFIKAA